jgi:hypothetical protein
MTVHGHWKRIAVISTLAMLAISCASEGKKSADTGPKASGSPTVPTAPGGKVEEFEGTGDIMMRLTWLGASVNLTANGKTDQSGRNTFGRRNEYVTQTRSLPCDYVDFYTGTTPDGEGSYLIIALASTGSRLTPGMKLKTDRAVELADCVESGAPQASLDFHGTADWKKTEHEQHNFTTTAHGHDPGLGVLGDCTITVDKFDKTATSGTFECGANGPKGTFTAKA